MPKPNRHGLAKSDNRGRVSLGRVISRTKKYLVESDPETGVITLTPAVVMRDDVVLKESERDSILESYGTLDIDEIHRQALASGPGRVYEPGEIQAELDRLDAREGR